MSIPEKLLTARLRLIYSHPYFTTAILSMQPFPSEEVPTMGVDKGWNLYYNPTFLQQQPIEQLAGILVHELGHLLRNHVERAKLSGGDVNKEIWNIAGDMEINDDLLTEGWNLPNPVTPQQFNFEPYLQAEIYYQQLFCVSQPCPHLHCGSGSGGTKEDWETQPEEMSPTKAELIRREVARQITQHQQQRGNIPSGWQRWAQMILSPVVNWKRELAALIRRTISLVAGSVDYSYHRPNRRQSAYGSILLPALVRPIPEVVIQIDTSGSMGEQQCARAVTEVAGILKQVCPKARVLSVDAAVHSCQQVFSARQITLLGGGGTDMGVGLQKIKRLKPRPSIAVVITDGYTPWPVEPPTFHVVVALVGGSTGIDIPPWARKVIVPN